MGGDAHAVGPPEGHDRRVRYILRRGDRALFLADLRARYRAEINQARTLRPELCRGAGTAYRTDLRGGRPFAAPGAAHPRGPQRTRHAGGGRGGTATPGRRSAEPYAEKLAVLVAILWTDRNGDNEAWSDERPHAEPISPPSHYFTTHRDTRTTGSTSPGRFAPSNEPMADRGVATPRQSGWQFRRRGGGAARSGLFPRHLSLGRCRPPRRGGDGRLRRSLFARQPPIEPNATRAFAGPSPIIFTTANAGTYETVSPVDQTPRIVGYKAGRDPACRACWSATTATTGWRSWYQHLYTFGPAALLAIFGHPPRHRPADVADRQARLQKPHPGGDAGKHGPWAVHVRRQQRLIVCNERYAKMYGLEADEMRPGTTLRAILEARVAAGSSRRRPRNISTPASPRSPATSPIAR